MAKRQTFRVLLVRSGATSWDESGRLQGDNDLPLSDAGRSAASAVIEGVDASTLSVILTSPDEASRQTAAMLAQRTGARVRKIDALTEIDLGLWEGMGEKQLRDRYAKAYGAWSMDPTGVTPPEGETITAAAKRVLPAVLRALDKAGGGPAALVLRPVTAGLVRCRLLDEPLANLWKVLENAPPAEWLDADRERLRLEQPVTAPSRA